MESCKFDKCFLISYTRNPEEEAIYAPKLADSMHLALVRNGNELVVLNHNSGVLFAKAIQNEDRTFTAKSLKNPWIFQKRDGGYGVLAQRIEADESEDQSSFGKLLLFSTLDFIHYIEHPLVKVSNQEAIKDAVCTYDNEDQNYHIYWENEAGKIFECINRDLFAEENLVSNPAAEITSFENLKNKMKFPENLEIQEKEVEEKIHGAKCENVISIPNELAEHLYKKLTVPYNTQIVLPDTITASSRKELAAVKGKALYSDGSSATKRIDWFDTSIDWDKPGEYTIKGCAHQDHYQFPIAFHRADPCIGRWEGKYYFIATNDADENHSLYIRQADTIPELVTAQEVKILDTNQYDHLGNLLWAPEFHIIKNRLYIFHAGTPQEFGDEQSHVMALKVGGNPMLANDWEMPKRVVKKDGSPLFTTGITLDMTCFEVKGNYYVAWSQREFVPKDLGAWIYFAQIDPDQPNRLITDPMVLIVPEYGWENNHIFVDEGPFALIRDGKVNLTYSGALVDSTYVVGILTADIDSDLLNPSSWQKGNYPILTSQSVEGEYGPGHNAYVEDEDGNWWNTYHARPGVTGPRSSGIRRVHFDLDGEPVLDLTEEKDLSPENVIVTAKVIVP